MKTFKILLLMVVTFLALACKKEQKESPSFNSAPINTRLDITVKHIYNISTLEDSLLPNAEVLLKVNANDMDFIKTGTTNEQGKVQFSFIDTPNVWIEASHPMVGQKIEQANLAKGNPNQRVISIF